MTKKLKKALEAILGLVVKKKPATLNEAKGMLAVIEVLADTTLKEVAEEELEKA
jgi:hypothetical protein